MPFVSEPHLKGSERYRRQFGEYLDTFVSERGQVRAAMFRRDDQLEVHATVMGGLNPEEVTDRYLTDVWEYAHEKGFDDRVRIIYSQSMKPIQDAQAPR